MIDKLLKDLCEAKSPDRSLDCTLYECVTGHLDCCRDNDISQSNRRYGRLLLERGAERLWVDVGRYTENVDELAPLLEPYMWSVAVVPQNAPERRFAAIIVREKMPPIKAFSPYRVSLALCQALLLLKLEPPLKAANEDEP